MAPESAALTEVRQRVSVLEVGHKQLIDQMADVAVRNEALDREILSMRDDIREAVKAVSYTHLTLPTNREV